MRWRSRAVTRSLRTPRSMSIDTGRAICHAYRSPPSSARRTRCGRPGLGERHARMLVAALRIFRTQLQIAYQDGEAALLPAFLAATDGKRKGEGMRILRDAWRRNGR